MEKANNANEMSDEVKKFSLKNVEDFLSDNEMKHTRGGSEGSGQDCYIKCFNDDVGYNALHCPENEAHNEIAMMQCEILFGGYGVIISCVGSSHCKD